MPLGSDDGNMKHCVMNEEDDFYMGDKEEEESEDD